MREIKFRAWDGERMLPQEALCWEDDRFISGIWDFEETHVACGKTEPEIMQYTGLKDKNGVEIYEGDILTRKYPQMPEKYPPKIIVQWDEEWNGWSFKPRLITTHGFYVMGNIHENPELLENTTGDKE